MQPIRRVVSRQSTSPGLSGQDLIYCAIGSMLFMMVYATCPWLTKQVQCDPLQNRRIANQMLRSNNENPNNENRESTEATKPISMRQSLRSKKYIAQTARIRDSNQSTSGAQKRFPKMTPSRPQSESLVGQASSGGAQQVINRLNDQPSNISRQATGNEMNHNNQTDTNSSDISKNLIDIQENDEAKNQGFELVASNDTTTTSGYETGAGEKRTWCRNVNSINGTIDLSQYKSNDVDRLYGDALLVYFKNFNE